MVEPAAEGAVFVEDALEFRRDAGDRFCRVRHQAEVRRVARGGVATGLQTLFDEHALVALAGGEDPSAQREAIDFAFDSDLGAGSPHFSDIERNADNDPVELRGYAFERGFEGFGHKFGLRFHGESRGKDNTVAGETRNQKPGIRKTRTHPGGGRCKQDERRGQPPRRVPRGKGHARNSSVCGTCHLAWTFTLRRLWKSWRRLRLPNCRHQIPSATW